MNQMKRWAVGVVVAGVACVACAQATSYSDEGIRAALEAHEGTHLLYMAAAAVQGTDGMTFGFDTWWRLCEGRWTKSVQSYLPGITDAELGRFLKRFGEKHRDVDPQSWLSPNERGGMMMPGETRTLEIPVGKRPKP